jgi:glutathione-regulated potassium-efflux system protein KefB
MLAGVAPVVAVIAASGFVLSSTAVIMQMMDERGGTATPAGQRAVSILLLEDLAIVPLLAMVGLLASVTGTQVSDGRPPGSPLSSPWRPLPSSSGPGAGCSTRSSACSPSPAHER